MLKIDDYAALDAALVAFDEEARLWMSLPNHGGARGYRASRRASLHPQSFVNNAPPLDRPTELAFDTMMEREQHVRRECMAKAVAAYQATTPAEIEQPDRNEQSIGRT